MGLGVSDCASGAARSARRGIVDLNDLVAVLRSRSWPGAEVRALVVAVEGLEGSCEEAPELGVDYRGVDSFGFAFVRRVVRMPHVVRLLDELVDLLGAEAELRRIEVEDRLANEASEAQSGRRLTGDQGSLGTLSLGESLRRAWSLVAAAAAGR